MSEKKQTGHKISVEREKGGGPNPILEHIMKKRGRTSTTEQISSNIFGKTEETKAVIYDIENEIKLPKYAQSGFFESLVNAYLNNPEYNQLFLTKNNSKITITSSAENAILKFTPKSEAANEVIKKAIECATKLLPFTAKSILCHHNYPNCAIEIIVNGSLHYNYLIHLMNKENMNLPYAYNINKEVIEFLCTKTHELSSSENLYRIALTGEALSFTLDDTNKEHRIGKINTSNCEKVFSPSYLDKNRLLLLVSPSEKSLPNQPKLEWITTNLNEDEESIQMASNLVRDIRVRHNNDLYIFKESNEFICEYSPKFSDKYNLDPRMSLNEVCQNFYENYTNRYIDEIPIIDLKFIKDMKTYTKRKKYSEIKKKIDEKYKSLNEKFDSAEVEKKKREKNILHDELKNMTKISNKHPKKREISNKLNSIKNYLNDYNNLNLQIKKLNEEKSRLNLAICDTKKFEKETQLNNIKGRLFNIFGVYCFSTEKPIEIEKEEFIQTKLFEISKKSQIDVVSIEKIIKATIYVNHHQNGSLSCEEFKQTISKVCQKFSFLVTYCSDYKQTKQSNLSGQIGLISIDIIYPKFAHLIVSEIKEALLGNQLHKFRIPRSIASKTMLLEEKNQEIIKNWLKENKLNSIKFNGNDWIGNKEDVRQAYKLLDKNETLPKFNNKVIPIPLFFKKSEIFKIIQIHNEKIDADKWDLDLYSNCLIVGNKDIDEANKIINKLELSRKPKSENDFLGCILLCENQNPSELQLNVYNRDGSCNTNYLCNECIMSTLDHNVNCFFEDKVGIDFEALMSGMKELKNLAIVEEDNNFTNNEYWPKVPIGQLLWNLVNDTKFSEKAKVWLTAMLYTSLHFNKEVVTFCPDHPYYILPRPKFGEKLHCSVKECLNIFCLKCNEWHTPEKQCSEWEGMKCPACKVPIEKINGCNLMNCTACGAIWCFKCGLQYSSVDECKEHMIKEHGTTYD